MDHNLTLIKELKKMNENLDDIAEALKWLVNERVYDLPDNIDFENFVRPSKRLAEMNNFERSENEDSRVGG